MMKKEKRYLCDWLKSLDDATRNTPFIALAIALFLIGLFTLFYVGCSFLSFNNNDILKKYYNYLSEVSDATIDKDNIVNIKNIPSDISYNITPDSNGNIICSYSIVRPEVIYSYEMRITMSKDGDILKQDCDIILKENGEYEYTHIGKYLFSALFASFTVLFLLILLSFARRISLFHKSLCEKHDKISCE